MASPISSEAWPAHGVTSCMCWDDPALLVQRCAVQIRVVLDGAGAA
jgi:hypothetical protein